MPPPYQALLQREHYIGLYAWKVYGTQRPSPLPVEVRNAFETLYELQAENGTLPFILPYLELCITSRCTLSCTYCSNLMSSYKSLCDLNDASSGAHAETLLRTAQDYPFDSLYRSLEKTLSSVDSIRVFRILGGEPLLHSDLAKIIRAVASFKKTAKIVIVTNGTLLPDEQVLASAREAKASFEISDYGKLSRQADALECMLAKSGIACRRLRELCWRDYGHKIHSYSRKEMKKVYRECSVPCKTLVHEEFHICPRSAHAVALGLVKRRAKDYIHVPSISVPELRCKIRELYTLEYVEACRCCNKAVDRIPVPLAGQCGDRIRK